MLECGFESLWGLESSGFGMWNFLKLFVEGFLQVLRFPSLLHRLMVSSNEIVKITATSALSNLTGELHLCTRTIV